MLYKSTSSLMINLMLFTVSIIFSLAVGEFLLRFFTPFPIYARKNLISHNTLGWVLNPRLKGIDTAGFRNYKIIDDPDIITIGDSHTYGFYVPEKYSWPTILSKISRLTVYNLGMGGYGILHYVYLLDKATEMLPNDIIIGFFLENDLADFCRIAHKPFWREILYKNNSNTGVCSHRVSNKSKKRIKTNPDKVYGLLEWLNKNTAIGNIVNYYFYDRLKNFVRIKISKRDHQDNVVTYGHNATILRDSEMIYKNMDSSEPIIREALKVTDTLFKDSIKRAVKKGINVHILFIPSKESVLYNYMKKKNYIKNQYVPKVVEKEEELVKKLTSLFNSAGAQTYFFRNEMSTAIEKGTRIYYASDQRHPTAEGYRIYAKTALHLLNPH
jgi:hypothetical protein